MNKLIYALAIVAWLAFPLLCHAQAGGSYATGDKDANGANASVSGLENSAIIMTATSHGPISSHRVLMVGALSANTSAAETAMVFDSATLPANNAIPIMSCPLSKAAANAPTSCSFSLPAEGLRGLTKGLTVACSTTWPLLTVDTTSGGNCFFNVSYK